LIEVDEALIADTPGFSSYEVFDFPVEELDLLKNVKIVVSVDVYI